MLENHKPLTIHHTYHFESSLIVAANGGLRHVQVIKHVYLQVCCYSTQHYVYSAQSFIPSPEIILYNCSVGFTPVAVERPFLKQLAVSAHREVAAKLDKY